MLSDTRPGLLERWTRQANFRVSKADSRPRQGRTALTSVGVALWRDCVTDDSLREARDEVELSELLDWVDLQLTPGATGRGVCLARASACV